VKPFLLGVIADLRHQRLLPIAIVLVAALVAVPVLLRKAPEPPSPAASAPVVETTPDGLPSPDAALGSDPLVTMASLEGSSDLDSFDARDPFKPLKSLDQVATGPALDGGTDLAAAGSDLGGSATDLASSGGSGGSSGSGDSSAGSGGGSAPSPGPDPSPTPSPDLDPTPAPQPDPDPDPDPQRLTYAIDVSFTGPDGRRAVRGLPRLSMLPSESAPLLVFLGVSDSGNEAVFLVDAKLTAETGEGDCVPSPEQCATLGLAPGEIQTFIDAEGRRYVLELDQIREIDAERAAQARERLAARAAGSSRPVVPFLPVLVDALTMGRR